MGRFLKILSYTMLNKATRSTEISRQQIQKQTPQTFVYSPLSPSPDVGNSIKREENMKNKL